MRSYTWLFFLVFVVACSSKKTQRALSISLVKERDLAGYWGDSTGQVLLVLTDSAEVEFFSNWDIMATFGYQLIWADSISFLKNCNDCDVPDFHSSPKLYFQNNTLTTTRYEGENLIQKKFWKYDSPDLNSKFKHPSAKLLLTEDTTQVFTKSHWQIKINGDNAPIQLFFPSPKRTSGHAYRLVKKNLPEYDTSFYNLSRYVGALEGSARFTEFIIMKHHFIQIYSNKQDNRKTDVIRSFLITELANDKHLGLELLGKGCFRLVSFHAQTDTFIEYGYNLFHQRLANYKEVTTQKVATESFIKKLKQLDFLYLPLAW